MSEQIQRVERAVEGWRQRAQWPHAVLMSGATSDVMYALARRLSKQRLCRHEQACDACDACAWFDASNHLDFHVLSSAVTAEELGVPYEGEGGTTRRIIRKDDVAACLRRLALKPHVQGGWRVLVLVHPEELHPAAANALLKTLEEPGDAVFFVLLSAQPRAVLDTIISRCQQLVLPPLSRADLAQQHEAAGEPKNVASGLAELQRYDLRVSAAELLRWRSDLMDWLQALAARESHRGLLAVDRLNKAGDPDRVVGLALSLTLDLLRLQSGMGGSAITHVDLEDDLRRLAPVGSWLNLSKTLTEVRPVLRRNVRLQNLLMGVSL